MQYIAGLAKTDKTSAGIIVISAIEEILSI